MKRTTKAKKPVEQTIVAYKGFDRSLQCRGFQYEVGKTYEHDGDVEACAAGFHACEHPLKVFAYYAPGKSRYAEVALAGTTAREASGDTKIAAAKITINVELSIGELVQRAWDYAWSRATVENGGHATGNQGAASATGDWGAAMSSGRDGRVQAAEGNALFLVERNYDYEIIAVWAGIAGHNGIKPMCWYTLRGGQPVEVK